MSPDQPRRVHPGGLEHLGGHRGRGGLAVRTGDGDNPAPIHERAESLRPLEDGNACSMRRLQLGVVRRNR